MLTSSTTSPSSREKKKRIAYSTGSALKIETDLINGPPGSIFKVFLKESVAILRLQAYAVLAVA